MEVLISNAFIDSNISHDEFVLTNNLLKEYDKIRKYDERRNRQCKDLFSLSKTLVYL